MLSICRACPAPLCLSLARTVPCDRPARTARTEDIGQLLAFAGMFALSVQPRRTEDGAQLHTEVLAEQLV